MHHRILSAILFALLSFVCFPDLIRGQSTDSLLYLIDNDLVKDESHKYDLLCQVIEEIQDTESKIRYSERYGIFAKNSCFVLIKGGKNERFQIWNVWAVE